MLTSSLLFQDHWLQGIYGLPGSVKLTKGSDYDLATIRTDTSIWFDVQVTETHSETSREGDFKRKRQCVLQQSAGDQDDNGPDSASDEGSESDDDGVVAQCSCGWHTLCNPERISALNNKSRTEKYLRALTSAYNRIPESSRQGSVWLDVNDGSFLALSAAALHPSIHAVSLEGKLLSRLLSQQLIDANEGVIQDRVSVVQYLSGDEDDAADNRVLDVLVVEL